MIDRSAPLERGYVGEVIRFLAVGSLAALNNVLIIVVLTEVFKLHYLVSYALCFVIVTGFAFRFNRDWTFRIDGRANYGQVLRYFGWSLVGLAMVMTITWALVQFGIPYYLGSLFAAALLVPFNFFAHRRGSFQLNWIRP